MNTRNRRKVLEINGRGTTTSHIDMNQPHFVGKFEAKIELPILETTKKKAALDALRTCLDKIDDMITLNQPIVRHKAHQSLQHAFYAFLIVSAIEEHGEKKAGQGSTK